MRARRTLSLWVEVVQSEKWPYLAIGRTWRRKPRGVTSPTVKISLDVPADLFEPSAEVTVTLPGRPQAEGEATWG